MLEVLVHRCRRRSFLFLSIFFLLFQLVAGQTLINGQTFTNGLAIIDSPSPQNPGNAGSSINIAVDVSGNGQLSAAASLPNSGNSTGFSSLEIYLVSAETNINMTVSAGSALLSGESGSTVKHLNWPISTCIPAGNYNLTFYESSVYNSQGVFAITPIPVPISNPNPAGPCTENLNAVQAQPQSSNPLPQSPFAPGLASAPSSSVTPTSVVPTSTRMVTVISGTPFVTLTLTISDGVLSLPTVTVTASATPTTVVIISTDISTDIITETDQGSVTTYTQTYTQTNTFTTVFATSAAPDTLDGSPGFIPVNSASHSMRSASWYLLFGALWTLLVYLRMF